MRFPTPVLDQGQSGRFRIVDFCHHRPIIQFVAGSGFNQIKTNDATSPLPPPSPEYDVVYRRYSNVTVNYLLEYELFVPDELYGCDHFVFFRRPLFGGGVFFFFHFYCIVTGQRTSDVIRVN